MPARHCEPSIRQGSSVDVRVITTIPGRQTRVLLEQGQQLIVEDCPFANGPGRP